MKTKIVPSTLLSRFHQESFYGVEKELVEAASALSERLGIDGLKLFSFNETTALYRATNGHLLRTGYNVEHDEGTVIFDEFADVVVDDISLVRENRKDLNELVSNLFDEDNKSAELIFDRYLERKMTIKESTEGVLFPEPEPVAPNEKEIEQNRLRKLVQESLGAAALFDVETIINGVAKRLQLENSMIGVVAGADEKPGEGKVNQITLQKIDTQKLSQIVWDRGEKLVEGVVEARRGMQELSENEKFADAVLKVKSLNATGELEEIGEAMSELVTSEPNILYLSLEEVAECVRQVLGGAETSNWDDELCLDIAEGAQKLAASVYQKTADRVSEAAKMFWAEDEPLPEDQWEAYKAVTKKLFEAVREGEGKLNQAVGDITDLIGRISPILKDEGYKRNEHEVGSVGRTLERYVEELKDATLDKVEEVVNFVQDYVLREAWQLKDDGTTPPEAHPKAQGDGQKDYNKLPYRTHPSGGKLGPYGEKPKLLEENVEELSKEFGVDPEKVVDWLSEYKEENEEATLEQAVNALKEAWQLDDDGNTPTEAHPKTAGSKDVDPNAGKPYRVHDKTGFGYMKDADSKKVDDLNVDGYEEVGKMADLVVPAKGKTAVPEIAEAWQLEDDGKTPAEAHPGQKNKGDPEKDYQGLPYRSHSKGGKLGPYGEKPKLMDDNGGKEERIKYDGKPKISVTGT